MNKFATWEGWMRLAPLAAVVALWFTADNSITNQQQVQISQFQARLAAQSQQNSALASTYGQLSSESAATRAAAIQKFPQLESENPKDQQHINTFVRNYLWDGLQQGQCTPSENIPVDIKAAFESTYDEFRVTNFNDGADWAIPDCMERLSADTIEVKWRHMTFIGQPGYADDYSATLHINKNLFGLGVTRSYLSCNCYEVGIFTARGRISSLNLTKSGPDAKEPYQADLDF
ncbi:hypothetical protein [Amycolatopsis sp. SID8362]|uniref:hypothetical protein n=1 Tax=Amycolatopsis sp. SID8362 TaxID=2690346 RepID=UPI001368E801|nr:hypothetical protein [Amycolatopsis sp. SID8362]NBH08712.1 hypothetical protein [Amycolatopsis sp. SID8362]NED45406.1 hypothetical protein [Amycolatopsis sp. SID8362]